MCTANNKPRKIYTACAVHFQDQDQEGVSEEELDKNCITTYEDVVKSKALAKGVDVASTNGNGGNVNGGIGAAGSSASITAGVWQPGAINVTT